MSKYGLYIPDAKNRPIQSYLTSYVIDVIKTNNLAGSKSYRGASELSAVALRTQADVFTNVEYSNNMVSWSNKGNQTIIVRGSLIGSPDGGDRYGVLMSGDDGQMWSPPDSKSYVFFKKMKLSPEITDTGLMATDPQPLMYVGANNLQLFGIGLTEMGSGFLPLIKNGTHQILSRYRSGDPEIYIFMPSEYVLNKSSKPKYGVVSFSKSGDIQFISGQSPLEFKVMNVNFNASQGIGYRVATLIRACGYRLMPVSWGMAHVTISSVGIGNTFTPLHLVTGSAGGSVPGGSADSIQYIINRNLYD